MFENNSKSLILKRCERSYFQLLSLLSATFSYFQLLSAIFNYFQLLGHFSSMKLQRRQFCRFLNTVISMRYFRGKWRTFAEICLHNSEQHFSDFSGPNLYHYLSWASMGRMTAIMSRVRVNANCDIPLAKGTNLWGWLEVLALWHIWTPPTKTRDRTQAESTTWKEVVNKSQKLALFSHTVPKIIFLSKNTFLVFFILIQILTQKTPKNIFF